MSYPSPLFVSDYPTLLKSLKVTAQAESSRQQIADAMLEVNIGLYERMGDTLVESLKAIPFTQYPTNADQRKRAKAALVEVQWVRAILMARMPTFFADGSETAPEVWNDEGIIRQNRLAADAEIKKLMASVDSMLDTLVSGIVPASSISVSTIGPDSTNADPKDYYQNTGLDIFSGY
jgi:hypothetical protein